MKAQHQQVFAKGIEVSLLSYKNVTTLMQRTRKHAHVTVSIIMTHSTTEAARNEDALRAEVKMAGRSNSR